MLEMKPDIVGRRALRKAERRDAIIQTATVCFLANGYGRTTMSHVAKRLGGSKGTLWSYFASKEDLFAAVLDSATSTFRQFATALLDTDLDPRDVLTGFCETFILRLGAPDAIALQRLVIGEVERFPEIGAIFYSVGPGQTGRTLSNYLASRIAPKRLDRYDPVEAAQMLLDLCAGGYHQRVLWGAETPDNAKAKREASRAVGLFLRCYPMIR